MAPQTILVRKGNQTKHMSTLAWSLLPADKQGWAPVENEVGTVVNEVSQEKFGKKSAKVVNTGVVTNEVVEEKDQTVSNEVPVVENEVGGKQIVIIPAEQKEAFIKQVEDAKITKTQLKDYLDVKEISYEQNESKTLLVEKLAEHLGNDVEKLKIEFSI